MAEVAERVRRFYNESPFPDFDLRRFETRAELANAAGPFARALDRSMPKAASVIDVGTGTGQLSAFLSLSRGTVWGIDFSHASLAKASQLKDKLGLTSWTLRQVDILDAAQVEGIGRAFDYVLCLGVLHHTEDPRRAFSNVVRLLRPGGYIALGLYNRLGRLPLKLRRLLVRSLFRDNDRVKDFFIRMQIGTVEDQERKRGWWNDQYAHPHELTHTIGEVLAWFRQHNVEYLQMLPPPVGSVSHTLELAGLWNPAGQRYPSPLTRLVTQFVWIVSTHHEGGYWVTFGRRRNTDS